MTLKKKEKISKEFLINNKHNSRKMIKNNKFVYDKNENHRFLKNTKSSVSRNNTFKRR